MLNRRRGDGVPPSKAPCTYIAAGSDVSPGADHALPDGASPPVGLLAVLVVHHGQESLLQLGRQRTPGCGWWWWWKTGSGLPARPNCRSHCLPCPPGAESIPRTGNTSPAGDVATVFVGQDDVSRRHAGQADFVIQLRPVREFQQRDVIAGARRGRRRP